MRVPYPLLPTLGTIPDDQIPCREDDITKLLRLLKSQSVSVEEMRRMGKSLMLIKMAYLCNHGKLPDEFKRHNFKARYMSFQGRQDLGQVIDLIMNSLKEFKEWYQLDFRKTYKFLRDLLDGVSVDALGSTFSVTLPEFRKSWKEILFKALDEIAEAQEKTKGILILIFDELPIMLWEWYKEGKHRDALELLDILRERRQHLEKRGIRFVYCGSIGIKVVLSTFRSEFKYTGEPTNEMVEFTLNPFSKADHQFLCECILLSGFEVTEEAKENCLTLLYELTNGLPFYTCHLFNIIQTDFDYSLSTATIKQAYELIINDTKYHGAFKQLEERLQIYYTTDIAKSMQKILTVLTMEDDYIREDQLLTKVNIEDEQKFKEAVSTLYGDHYLSRVISDGKRTYKFRFQIFKEWWRINIA
ncbi:hypothetical protein [Chitinophaga sp. HK235]|uniref:hypothetical protein n=1 Tax=Chitinophaga sp. HK235 TaxID=2952571 RepID=UPI001BA84DE3|nr:hypothetical protein [Chitinophaga sp. HK235]